jgi:hypothetical protein
MPSTDLGRRITSCANYLLFLPVVFFAAPAHAQQSTHISSDCGDAVFLYKDQKLYAPCMDRGGRCKTSWDLLDVQVTDVGNGKLLVRTDNYSDLICSRDRSDECGCRGFN